MSTEEWSASPCCSMPADSSRLCGGRVGADRLRTVDTAATVGVRAIDDATSETAEDEPPGDSGDDESQLVTIATNTAPPTTTTTSPFSSATAVVADGNGDWAVTVFFSTAPANETFTVWVPDGSSVTTFDFVHVVA